MVGFVEDGRTPEEWCKNLRKCGIRVSPRTLRLKAREHGQYLSLGRVMVLNPNHIEYLMSFEANETRVQIEKAQIDPSPSVI